LPASTISASVAAVSSSLTITCAVENGLQMQWRGAQSFQDTALSIGRDNRDQRQHRAYRDKVRHNNRQTHMDKIARGEQRYDINQDSGLVLVGFGFVDLPPPPP
jgi:hypothetical protein